MSAKIGSFIKSVSDDPNPNGGGESAGDSTPDSSIGTSGGNFESEPEPAATFISGSDIFEPIEPAGSDAGGPDASAGSGKRRGRKPGWRKAAEQTPVPPNLADIDFGAVMLQAHSMLAALTSVQELELDRKEADKLTAALKNALKFHPAGISPEKMAYINLGLVAVEIYGTRALAYRMRTSVERANRRPPTPIAPRPAAPGSPAAPGAPAAPAGPFPAPGAPAAPRPPAAQGTGTFGPSLCEPASEGIVEP